MKKRTNKKARNEHRSTNGSGGYDRIQNKTGSTAFFAVLPRYYYITELSDIIGQLSQTRNFYLCKRFSVHSRCLPIGVININGNLFP